jgi:serine/threonine protein kinase
MVGRGSMGTVYEAHDLMDPAEEFLVMEHIAGEALGALLERSPGDLPAARVMAWADQLLHALEYLYSQPMLQAWG